MSAVDDRPGHPEMREALGALALGQLDDDLRAAVQAHLATCPSCPAELDDLRPVVEALHRVDPDAVRPVGITPPAELDERIRRALPVADARPASTTRRWAPVAAAALVAAAAAVVVTAVVVRDDEGAAPTSPTVVAVPRMDVARGVVATAGLVDHTWGVEVKLQATGLRGGERFRMWVLGDDGRRYDAGGFIGVDDTTITCDMASAVLLDDAASFRVVDASGDEVIAGDIGS